TRGLRWGGAQRPPYQRFNHTTTNYSRRGFGYEFAAVLGGMIQLTQLFLGALGGLAVFSPTKPQLDRACGKMRDWRETLLIHGF
ncbi:MAG TPA: hypothetical protein VF607_13935, partial [Verrucomicrobiae bacterium]